MPEQYTAITLTSDECGEIYSGLRTWATAIEADPAEIARINSLAELFMKNKVHLIPTGQATGQ